MYSAYKSGRDQGIDYYGPTFDYLTAACDHFRAQLKFLSFLLSLKLDAVDFGSAGARVITLTSVPSGLFKYAPMRLALVADDFPTFGITSWVLEVQRHCSHAPGARPTTSVQQYPKGP